MIYWMKKLEWRIRKWLGLYKKRVKTIDDVQTLDMKFMIKIMVIYFLINLALRIGEDLYRLWWWFFPRIIRAPMEFL